MESKAVFVKGIHMYSFRCGESGIVTGMKWIIPDGKPAREYKPRLCYEVTYPDGFVDLVPLCDIEDGVYQIVGESK